MHTHANTHAHARTHTHTHACTHTHTHTHIHTHMHARAHTHTHTACSLSRARKLCLKQSRSSVHLELTFFTAYTVLHMKTLSPYRIHVPALFGFQFLFPITRFICTHQSCLPNCPALWDRRSPSSVLQTQSTLPSFHVYNTCPFILPPPSPLFGVACSGPVRLSLSTFNSHFKASTIDCVQSRGMCLAVSQTTISGTISLQERHIGECRQGVPFTPIYWWGIN